MKSEYRITSQYINDKKIYAVYRLKDVNAVDHSGNREYAASDYMEDRAEAEKLMHELNKENHHD